MKRESEMCRNWRLSLLGDVSRIKIYRRGPTRRHPRRYVVVQEYEKGDHRWMSFVYVNNVRHFKKKVEIHNWKTTDAIMLQFFEWDDKLEWVFDDSVTSRPKKKLEEIPKVHMSLRHPEIEIYDHEFWLIDLIEKKWWFPLF